MSSQSDAVAHDMAPISSYIQFNPARVRSYLLRLPLFTRVVIFIIVALWIAAAIAPSIVMPLALVPSLISLGASESRNLSSPRLFRCGFD